MNAIAPDPNSISADPSAWFVHRSGVVPLAMPGTLADAVLLLRGEPDAWSASCGVRWRRGRAGSSFQVEGAVAEAIHIVHTGSFKTLQTADDGYEHVLGFSGVGEVLGFEGLARGRHRVSAIALDDASVLTLPLHELDGWRRQSPAFDQALQRALSHQLARASETAAMMSAVAAEARLARFLVWLSAHMASLGQSPRRFVLRMNRRDIASLLGVAHETISRSFSLMVHAGLLSVDNREVEILDMPGLLSFARCTRRELGAGHRSNGAPPARTASVWPMVQAAASA